MRKEQISSLSHGLYRVFWKSGGSSLASIGSTHNGSRWLAPCNWTYENSKGFGDLSKQEIWDDVESVHFICGSSIIKK